MNAINTQAQGIEAMASNAAEWLELDLVTKEQLQALIAFSSTDSGREEMGSIYFDLPNYKAVATNGKSLMVLDIDSIRTMDAEERKKLNPCNLPQDQAKQYLKIMRANSRMQVRFGPNSIVVFAQGLNHVVYDLGFVDYERVIKMEESESDIEIGISVEQLDILAKAAKKIAGKKGTLRMVINEKTRSSRGPIRIEYTKEDCCDFARSYVMPCR